MSTWNKRGRGDGLEELIIASNLFYHRNGTCRIDKAATPVKAVRVVDGTKIEEGYYEKQSTVDFYGIAQGHFIAFDAKQTSQSSLPLKNIAPHQVDYMRDVDKQGGLTFIIVEFTKVGRYFILPFEILLDYVERADRGGRKSIPMEAIPESLEIELIKGVRLLYLEALNAYMDWKEEQGYFS